VELNVLVFKLETIGDAYVAVSGLPLRNEDLHAAAIADFALDIQSKVLYFQIPDFPSKNLLLRIAVHTGRTFIATFPKCATLSTIKQFDLSEL